MVNIKYSLTVMFVIIASLVGGFLSNYLFTVGYVFAKKPAKQTKVISAEEFILVEKNGKTRAIVGLTESGDISLTVLDKSGQHRSVFTLPSPSPQVPDSNPKSYKPKRN